MAERILLASQDHSSRITHWTDELYCTRKKDGKFSLRERKVGDGGRHWFSGTNSIETPRQFMDAYDGLEHVDTDAWDFEEDIIPKIFQLDIWFAILVEKELKLVELEDETELRIGHIVAQILRKTEVQFPSGTTNRIVHARYVDTYVEDFLKKNGKPPIGKHSVHGLPITFSDTKIDVKPWEF